MKLENLIRYNPKTEPEEVLEIPLSTMVLSQTEVLRVVNTLRPRWAWIVKVDFKHACHLHGRCQKVFSEKLGKEGFILSFYGKVYLSTVLHELAHVADDLKHGHGELFKNWYRALIKNAKFHFELEAPKVLLERKEWIWQESKRRFVPKEST